MADEQTHTETSATETATTETTAETVETGAETSTEGTAAAETGDDLSTALGGDATEGEGAETEGEGEGTEAKAEVPETYELTPPEGFEKLDDETVAEATPVFKELGLSNDQAQKLIPVAGKFAQKIVADRDAHLMGTIMEQRKDWLETARKDSEIGGANWDASLAASSKAMDQLGFPKGSPLRAALNDSGFGNHPEMIRFMAKVGKAIGEDSDFGRSVTGGEKKTDAEIFYPNSQGANG